MTTKETILQIAAMKNAGTRNLDIITSLNIKPSTLSYWIKRLRKEKLIGKAKRGRKPLKFDNPTTFMP